MENKHLKNSKKKKILKSWNKDKIDGWKLEQICNNV